MKKNSNKAGANKTQCYRSLDCRKSFQLDDTYNAYKLGMKAFFVFRYEQW